MFVLFCAYVSLSFCTYHFVSTIFVSTICFKRKREIPPSNGGGSIIRSFVEYASPVWGGLPSYLAIEI